jgi:hypothetical protein
MKIIHPKRVVFVEQCINHDAQRFMNAKYVIKELIEILMLQKIY